MYERN